MRTAYLFLGLLFFLLFAGAAVLFDKGNKPQRTMNAFSLTSAAFENNGLIPSKFTCDGDNINPELSISGVPADTKSLALIMDDPDIPEEITQSRGIKVFDHWVLYNISPETSVIGEGSAAGAQGLNTSGKTGYTGPCPPAQYEPKEHRYIFKLYALSNTLNFIKAPTKKELEQAMEGNIIGTAELVGRYRRL